MCLTMISVLRKCLPKIGTILTETPKLTETTKIVV